MISSPRKIRADTFAIFADPAYKTLVPYVAWRTAPRKLSFLLELGDSQVL